MIATAMPDREACIGHVQRTNRNRTGRTVDPVVAGSTPVGLAFSEKAALEVQ